LAKEFAKHDIEVCLPKNIEVGLKNLWFDQIDALH
jgi:hypothetical protein